MAITERLKNVWNAFLGRDPTFKSFYNGYASSYNPSRHRSYVGNDRSTVRAIFDQISVDCSAININHVKLNDDGKFEKVLDTSLNRALSSSANVDQTGRALIREGVFNMLDDGHVAFVPVITEGNPEITDSYKVEELRVGKVVEWFPKHVRVDLYNEETGQHEQPVLQKRYVAIIENPFYEIMNEPNSTMQRLSRVYRQLDSLNDQASSGKLDLIIQLPYVIRSEARRKQANARRKEIEAQLTQGQYGIAYTDGTERVIQLNRSLENNLWAQAKELQEQLYNLLGFSQAIFDGTADEKTMLNYNNRTIEPILSAITEEMERKWISRTAKTQKQAIRFFRDPFKLVPVVQLAEIVDKFTRNEVMSSNEFRAVIGLKPSKDPKADQLINSNLNQPDSGTSGSVKISKKGSKVNIDEIVERISK